MPPPHMIVTEYDFLHGWDSVYIWRGHKVQWELNGFNKKVAEGQRSFTLKTKTYEAEIESLVYLN